MAVDVLDGADFSSARADLVLSCPQAACKEPLHSTEGSNRGQTQEQGNPWSASASAKSKGKGKAKAKGGQQTGPGKRIAWYADGSAMHRIAVLRARHKIAL